MNKKQREIAVKQFEAFCKKNFIETESHYADTGSVYIDALGETFRFADHADAYGTSFYTCDGCEGTYKGAVKALKSLMEKEEPFEKEIRRIKKLYEAGKIDFTEKARLVRIANAL